MDIGKFRETVAGCIEGSVETLVLSFKCSFRPIPRDERIERGPDYRIIARGVEVGKAWRKTPRDSDIPYLSCKIDDPTFSAPIYPQLHRRGDGWQMVWTR